MVSRWTKYGLAGAILALEVVAYHVGKPRMYETEKGRVVRFGLSAQAALDEDRDGTLDRYFIGVGVGRGGAIVELDSEGEVVSERFKHVPSSLFESQIFGLQEAYDSLMDDMKLENP